MLLWWLQMPCWEIAYRSLYDLLPVWRAKFWFDQKMFILYIELTISVWPQQVLHIPRKLYCLGLCSIPLWLDYWSLDNNDDNFLKFIKFSQNIIGVIFARLALNPVSYINWLYSGWNAILRQIIPLNFIVKFLTYLSKYHYTPRFNKVERGVYWFHLVRLSVSVCGQNRVHSVSSTILIGSISYLHILSSNFRRFVACNACYKIKKFGGGGGGGILRMQAF